MPAGSCGRGGVCARDVSEPLCAGLPGGVARDVFEPLRAGVLRGEGLREGDVPDLGESIGGMSLRGMPFERSSLRFLIARQWLPTGQRRHCR